MKRFIKEKRGFTLIEILAVIVLISLIVIIAVPSVKSVSAKSKRKLFDTKVKITEEAVNLWGESNLSCFETGCDVLSDCQDIENNTRKCKTTFGLLAENNIINYDGEVDGVEYVVNPIDSSNMNDYEIFVFLNNNNNIITSELNKDSIKDPEIIDIISNKNNNNIGNDADKDANNKTTEDADKDSNNNTTEGSSNNTITITIDYNNGEITTISSNINATVTLDETLAKKDGYKFDQWKITSVSDSASVNGKKLTVSNSDVTVQAQYKPIEPVSFESDSWAVIAANVKEKRESTKNTYSVGSEKEVLIDVNGDGTKESYKVRIANNSNYNCSLESKTACGFVVEFVDIVEQRVMDSSNTKVGGWPATDMRTYLNGGFLAKLPSDLQREIADTTVVSGRGLNDSSNFTSTDKIYLLSTKEVWGYDSYLSEFDTATGSTRQLEFYANNNVTTSNYSVAIKNYAGSAAWWWLRAVHYSDYDYSYSFRYVNYDGYYNGWISADTSFGVAPAFRIK